MKASTLNLRIAKSNNANGSAPKNSDYEMAINILSLGKMNKSYYSGNGKFSAIKERNPERYLIEWGIDFKTGNDAPRGGKIGNFIQLTKKGLSQVKEYRLELKNKSEAKTQRDLSVLEDKKNDILKNISENKDYFENGLLKMADFHNSNDKKSWQIKANELVQTACKNDFTYG